MRAAVLSCLALLLGAGFSAASDRIAGEATDFVSPNGVVERCVRIAPMPGGDYSKGDLSDEEAFCKIDLYAPGVALCPKTWSTSAGMMVYDISSGSYAGRRDDFQRRGCAEGKSASGLAAETLAKFKPTMNAKGTSGTFSTSSLLYYHFSRYFEMEVKVPVAVWRSMDRVAHRDEVATRGLALSGNSHSSRMNHEAWRLLVTADERPDAYRPIDELFTSDRNQIYGALVTSPGHRYGAEINGTRKSGWGKGQNLDFQETAPFLALRSTKPLAEAIAEGVEKARRDPQIRRDLGDSVGAQQMVYWMREISEIVLLDFIFSQQDRVGNIDFTEHWYWVENGELKHKRTKHHEAEDAPVPGAILLRRTRLNDNDAGGRVEYANFAKSTGMLEKLRHFDGGVYRRLMALDADFATQGELFAYVRDSFGLDARQLAQIIKNTGLASGILRASCERGELRFDLDPETFLLEGSVTAERAACGGK